MKHADGVTSIGMMFIPGFHEIPFIVSGDIRWTSYGSADIMVKQVCLS
jgi:hypothetical protein